MIISGDYMCETFPKAFTIIYYVFKINRIFHDLREI